MKKMIMAVIPRDQSNQLLERLTADGYSATYTESHGGMLRQSQQMLFIVVEEEQVDDVLKIIRGGKGESDDPPAEEKQIGRSSRVVFVWNVESVKAY